MTEGQLAEPLDAAVFAAPQGELEGPLKEAKTKIYTVFEVMKITPEKVQSLDETKSQISAQLAEQAKQETFARFVRGYGSRWKSRTFCSSDFLIERCANFKGDGRAAGSRSSLLRSRSRKLRRKPVRRRFPRSNRRSRDRSAR